MEYHLSASVDRAAQSADLLDLVDQPPSAATNPSLILPPHPDTLTDMKPQMCKSLLVWDDDSLKLVRVEPGQDAMGVLAEIQENMGRRPGDPRWECFQVYPEEMTESTLAGFVAKSVHDQLSFDADNWTNRFRLADALVFRLLAVMAPAGEEATDTERAIRAEMDVYRQNRLDQEASIKRQTEERKEAK